MSLLGFNTNKNYLKRASSSGMTSMTAPNSLNSWFNYESTLSIPHGLSYRPKRVRVYYEPFADGKIYPASGSRLSGTAIGVPVNETVCFWDVDSTNLNIQLESLTSETGTRNVYYIIYLDQ